MDRRRVLEEEPAGETRPRERGDAPGVDRQPVGVAGKDGARGVRVNGQDQRSHPRVVAHGVGVPAEEQLGLDAAPVPINSGRLAVDHARELVDRPLVAALVDQSLTLLGRARRRLDGGHEQRGQPRDQGRGGEPDDERDGP